MPGNAKALFPKSKQPGIFILEDLMIRTMNKDEEALHTVTLTAHHSNIFLIFTQQCLHPRGRNAVQLRQNFNSYIQLLNRPLKGFSATMKPSNNLNGCTNTTFSAQKNTTGTFISSHFSVRRSLKTLHCVTKSSAWRRTCLLRK